MARPDPEGGLVVRYDYLWASEEFKYAQGEKRRPCAVAIPLPATAALPLRALVCGITHTKPRAPSEGIEIPVAVKAKLGLDQERSWIVTSEVNIVEWSDPGIVKTPSGQWSYGFLPRALMQEVVGRILARAKAGDLERVNRVSKPEARAKP